MMTRIKTEQEVLAMRESGKMLATVLMLLKQRLQTGMSPKDLADIAKSELRSLGGTPAFLGYQGFPDVLCVSINDEVVHGIPKTTIEIRDGDIVSMDFGVSYQGMITDAAISVVSSTISDAKSMRLIEDTERSLMKGIDVVKNGTHTGDIGAAVEDFLKPKGYGIVRDLVGHGVGHELHEEPDIPNYGSKGTGKILLTGMTVAIEPMATMGGHEVMVGDDGWTVRTRDGSRAAHFEHTVLVTDAGAEILTLL